MLKVRLRSLEKDDFVLQEKGLARDLGLDLDPELCQEPLEIYCKFSKTVDLVSTKGWVKGKMLLTCDRCLKEFESPYQSFFETLYRPNPREYPKGAEEKAPLLDDEEIISFDGEILDISDQVRQTVVLSVPMRALCREDCLGLCGGCGRDLNLESCQCQEPPADSRWEALRKIKF